MDYGRVLLKLSGEVLAGEQGTGLKADVLERLAGELSAVVRSGIETAVVIGGGNFFRGLSAQGRSMGRVTADYIGMLGTVMNGLALADFLSAAGTPAVVQSAVEIPRLCERLQPLRAREHLQAGRVVIFAGGTGNPFFTTDTTAALRAAEIGADVVLKGTKVDGIYSGDPVHDASAERFETITFDEVLTRQLEVMDLTAITMCRENGLPIVVFNVTEPGAIERVVRGEGRSTRVVPSAA
jgi:uridylate kinase